MTSLLQATSYKLQATFGQHFAYALGRMGVLETQLLQQTDIDRLLGAHSGEEAVKMLRDIEFLAAPEDVESFQDTLNASAALVKENVERMAPQEKHLIFDILWLEGDRARTAYELKKKQGFVSDVATQPAPPISAGLDLTLEQSFSSPQEIDNAVAHACNVHALKLAQRSASKAIIAFVEHSIELENARTKLRTSEKLDMETIVFEKHVVATLGEELADMKRMLFGPEALFSYGARALQHIALLRVLLTGKVNNLPIQEIKSLLPPLL